MYNFLNTKLISPLPAMPHVMFTCFGKQALPKHSSDIK